MFIFIFVLEVVAEYCSSYHDRYGTLHGGFNCPEYNGSPSESQCCESASSKYCCSDGNEEEGASFGLTIG